MYVLIVKSKKVTARDDPTYIMTDEDEEFWVLNEEHGWVPATSMSRRLCSPGEVPSDAKTFATEEDAKAFAKSWKGHPWYCQPNGKHEVLRAERVYRQIPDGYRLVE